jgi:formylmethanofuran dehydrogenase subunit E-like metal-binding protein
MTYRDNPMQENIQSISKADVLFAKALDVNPCRKPWVKTANHTEETLESNTVGLWDPGQNTKELHRSRP